MMTTLVSLYIKLNLLIALSYLLWVSIRHVSGFFNWEISHHRQLELARVLFLLMVFAAPVFFALNRFMPGLFQTFVFENPTVSWAGEMSVSGDIVTGLQSSIPLGANSVTVLFGVGILLVQGLLFSLFIFIRNWLRLRNIIRQGVTLRSFHGIHILFSNEVHGPFSTVALGKGHIVLPYILIQSPENLRLAVKHELQHLRNGDLKWVLFIEALKLLCFWNPGIYAWRNEFDCLQEYACDEAVVEKPSVSSKKYGHCLLEIATAFSKEGLVGTSNMAPRFSLFSNTQSQLKRRVMMLTTRRSSTLNGLKSLVYGAVFCFGMVSFATILFTEDTFAQNREAPKPRDRGERPEMLPIATEQPTYPQMAVEQGIEGWALVGFTVTEKGEVWGAEIIDSEPTGIFDSSALKAIEKFEFNPKMTDGSAVEVEGVRYLFRFNLQK